MRTRLCEEFGIAYPIFGFTPVPEVAAAISRAGGFGVLGAVRYNDPDELARALDWMDANVDGRPYGVDVVMPVKLAAEGPLPDLQSLLPEGHRRWVEQTLARLGAPPLPPDVPPHRGVLGWLHDLARSHVDVALEHPVRLIANALGSPPPDVIERAHRQGVKVAALAGSRVHAERHVQKGVDVVVAQGYEAGGHTGEIATMVLVPEVVDAVGPHTPVLAAGGIGTGRQICAALALGAEGVWMGSVWLTTAEGADLGGEATRRALLRATSSDTVRTRIYTGKPARLLRTKWVEAWEEEGAPEPLPMPLQNLLVAEAHQRLALSGDPDLVAIPVGQIVGRMNEVRPVAEVIQRLVAEFEDAAARLRELSGS